MAQGGRRYQHGVLFRVWCYRGRLPYRRTCALLGCGAMIDPKAEAEHNAAVREVAYFAFLSLRDTLSKNFDAARLGYKDVEHARLTMIQQADKEVNKLCAAHLKRQGK